MSARLVTATIDLKNYSHNLLEIRKIVPETVHIMAIVKANAYGHGLTDLAAAATSSGVSYLGVVSLGELRKIRTAGILTPTLILNYLDSTSTPEAVALDASITVFETESISAAETASRTQSKITKVHLKVDTGMHRAGCDLNQALVLAKQIEDSPQLKLEGVFTHFAESEALDPSFTLEQLRVFGDVLTTLRLAGITPPLVHCANSAAIITFPETHFTMVRPGLVSFGLNPFPKEHSKHDFVEKNFKPVLSLKTQVVLVRTVEAGETVGYNRHWKATEKSVVALLPVGYGDGYRRTPHNAGKVIVNGQYAPIIGSVAMDQTVINITHVTASVRVGDPVILIGTQGDLSITADDLADAYDTINYEVVTALSDRVVRNFIH